MSREGEDVVNFKRFTVFIFNAAPAYVVFQMLSRVFANECMSCVFNESVVLIVRKYFLGLALLIVLLITVQASRRLSVRFW